MPKETSDDDGGLDAKRLRKAIGQFKALLTRTEKYAQEQKDQVLLDLEGLKLRMEEVQRGLQTYKSLSLDLLLLTDEEPGEEDDVEERYFAVMSKLRKLVEPGGAKNEKREDDDPQMSTAKQQYSRLPKLDINQFDGRVITEYKPFIDIFNAVVDNDVTVTAVQKLFYLKKYLQGDALLLIDGLPLVNASYAEALQLLDKRYNNMYLVVTHHVNALLDHQPISRGTSSELRHLVSVVRQHVGALHNLGQQTQHWDMIIMPIILRKLDALSSRIYYSERDATKLPTLEDLLSFIERRAMSFEESQVSAGKSNINKNYNNKTANLANVCEDKILTCLFCKGTGHKIFACVEFQALSAQDRIDFAANENLCKICLNIHKKKCNFHFKCSVCKSKEHNTLLHSEKNVCNLSNSQFDGVSKSMVLLPTIKVNFRTNDGSYITARGLVDSGSQVSFINLTLLNKLNIPTFNYEVNVTALGQVRKPVAKAVNLSMYSRHNNYSCNTLFSVVDNITSFLPQTKCDLSDIAIPSSIKLADDEFNVPGEIQFLVSANVFFKLLLPDKISLSRNLYLMATQYGYIISGDINKDNICLISQDIPNDQQVLHAILDEERVDSLLQKFWEEQHTPEIKDEGILKQDVCEIEFQKSVKLKDNRFQVSLPLKMPIEEVKLGDSFRIALQRLNVLCKKFSKNEELKSKYVQFINEYLALGHAKKINLFELKRPLQCCYVLPHHAVFKMDSVTTKLRVVFDASAKTELNLSLNNILHVGPVVQKELFDILVQFRTYKYIVMTDIKQMYRQILIDPDQAHLQLILWKENIDDPLICLQLQTVTYGVSCSSFLATRCLVELARMHVDQYPLAASVLLNNSYVDDCLFGASSLDEARQVCRELIELAGLGGFELHKWAASHPKILLGVDPSKQLLSGNKNINNAEFVVKALGLQLNISSDQFIITQACSCVFKQWTKRTVLSFIGSFFDPLGLAGPIVTRAKEFLQKVWQLKLEWDTPLPDEVLVPWNSFFTDLMNMKPIFTNRDLAMCGAITIDLIGYCDASSIAYGACVYVRAVHDNNIYVNLVCSKSRIAPIKTKQTIPRLELNACLLLAKLYSRVYGILQGCNNINNKFLYSDSQVALCWLQNPPTKDSYVSRRAIATREQTKEFTWAHVSGSCNPADCLSRGLMPSELCANVLWWHGPPELKEANYSPKQFCAKNVSDSIDKMDCEPSVNCTVNEEWLPISKFSSMLKLQRVICYILRFIKNCRLKKEDRNVSKQLNVKEYTSAMQVIVKHVQLLHFNDDIQCIKNCKDLKSNLKKLCPFMDSDGLLRVGGRLDNASIPFSQKHPVILPKKCHFTMLVIQQEHISLLHAGLKLTLSSLSRRYYIVSATTLVKNLIHRCVLCFKFRAQKAQQLMASLPQDRVVQNNVFSKVGMDYCGPFNIKQSSMRRSVTTKGYVCIFVCFSTKCTHLELVSDLTTESFLAAFKRFHARRGLPLTVYCDNASTFKGANNQLRELFALCKSQSHQSAVIDYCNIRGIDFKFIPSYSPTWGGLWEAAVKSAKYHFKRIIGNLILTYEQFNTIIIQVEGILNSRPITQFTGDVEDFTFLTPAHFLINRPITALPDPEINTTRVDCLSFWRKVVKIRQEFWRVWHQAYLSQMLSRPKWCTTKPNIEQGVLVLLLGDNVPPLHWPVGRVTKLIKSRDGLVRAVEVKTKSGYMQTRAINKIAVLPIYSGGNLC